MHCTLVTERAGGSECAGEVALFLRRRIDAVFEVHTVSNARLGVVATTTSAGAPGPGHGGTYGDRFLRRAEGVVRAAYLRVLPTKVRHVAPQFPAEALQAGTRGVVVVETRIEADGRIVNARVIRSNPVFDQAVLDAVLQWEFTPTIINGKAIPVLLTTTVRFTGS